MRLHLTAATKMWLLTSLALFYIIIQYHVSNTWPVPSSARYVQENESEAQRKLWLKRIVGNSKVAEEVQNLIGEKASEDLAKRIDRQLLAHSCTIRDNSTLFNTPTIYIITPTYRRPEQQADLTRLAQTLMHVENIYWLLIEDAKEKSEMVSNILKKTGIRHIHLNVPKPMSKKYKGSNPRGVGCRNKGLTWIRENAHEGVMYFADDDNTYDIELFKEMRYTKRVSMWPVGLVTQTGVSSPIVKNGKLVGFYDGWIAGRKFAVDMAGFAVNIKFLKTRPNATMAYKLGYEEDSFLKSLAPLEPRDLELKADNCTKILVWHTQTKKNPSSQLLDKKKYNGTNLIELKKFVV